MHNQLPLNVLIWCRLRVLLVIPVHLLHRCHATVSVSHAGPLRTIHPVARLSAVLLRLRDVGFRRLLSRPSLLDLVLAWQTVTLICGRVGRIRRRWLLLLEMLRVQMLGLGEQVVCHLDSLPPR